MTKTYKEYNKEVMNSFNGNGTLELARKDNTKMLVEVKNATGYDQQIDLLTQVMADVVEEKVYSENIEDFMTISSEGGYADSITYFTEKAVGDLAGDSSADGINGQGNNVDVLLDKKTADVEEWKKGYDVSDTEMEQAMFAMNRSAIESKERSFSRIKQSYLVKHAFAGNGNLEGLLNLSDVAIDTTTMPVNISAMSVAQIESFVSGIYNAFRVGNNFTAHADKFLMPASEQVKLARIYSQYGITSILDVLQKAFVSVSGNSNFKIVSTLYAEASQRGVGAKNLYMLYNSANVRKHIPVDKQVVYVKGMDIRADKKVRLSETYITRPQEALYFEPVA